MLADIAPLALSSCFVRCKQSVTRHLEYTTMARFVLSVVRPLWLTMCEHRRLWFHWLLDPFSITGFS